MPIIQNQGGNGKLSGMIMGALAGSKLGVPGIVGGALLGPKLLSSSQGQLGMTAAQAAGGAYGDSKQEELLRNQELSRGTQIGALAADQEMQRQFGGDHGGYGTAGVDPNKLPLALRQKLYGY